MHSVIDHNAAYSLCILWFALLLILYIDARTKASSGLTLIYAAQLSILHLPGGMLLLVPWYEYYPRAWTFLGFQMTSFGLIAFVAGVLFARLALPKLKIEPKLSNPAVAKRLGAVLIATGIGLTFLISQANFLFQIPSVSAVLSGIWLLGAPGLCIYMHAFILNGEKMPAHVYFIALGFPALSILLLGFLGFGITYVIFIICFGICQKYFPKLLIVFAPALVYVGISFFVNYLAERDDIRAAVWGEKSLSVRTDAASAIFTDFEWFDPDNFFHLKALDDRLNQNWLVGAAAESIEFGHTELLDGESLAFALVAWVPRAIWTNKPGVAGSGGIAAALTGLSFADGTSITHPDLLLLDLGGLHHPGIATCRAFKERSSTRDLPIIIMTSQDSGREAKLLAWDTGADEYFEKPLERMELGVRARALLKRKLLQDQLSSSFDDLSQRASEDPLTGLANRGTFDRTLEREFARAQAKGCPLSLLLLDVDHFKHFNDQNGHPVGDTLLRDLCNLLSSEARRRDTVARYGGEEFAFILPDASELEGLQVIERLQSRIRQTRFVGGEGQPGGKLTVSIGLAALPFKGVTEPIQLLKKADQALYAAKNRGRNCSVSSSELNGVD